MHKHELCLTPIPCKKMPPPENTQIQVRCFTCKKFDVCRIKEDYLKTAMLISNVLGAPSLNFSLNWIPNFCGTDIVEPLNYFPFYVRVTNTLRIITCSFLGARYLDKNNVSLVYGNAKENFVGQFKVMFNEEENKWKFFMGEDVYTKESWFILQEETQAIEEGLIRFRETFDTTEGQCQCNDVIETTAFLARLECDHYDAIKNLSYCDGMKMVAEKYPCGVPIGCGRYYHIATYHVEPHKVPLYHPFNGVTAYMPMPYPVMIPPKCEQECKCDRTHRRDDNGKLQ